MGLDERRRTELEGAFLAPTSAGETGHHERRIAPLIAPDTPTFAETSPGTLDRIPDGVGAVVMGAPYEGYIPKDRHTNYAPGTVPTPDPGELYSRAGAYDAPRAIRQASMIYSFEHSGGRLAERGVEIARELGVVDCGDVCGRHEADQTVIDRISQATATVSASGAVPVVIGGDHAISYPALLGIAEATRKRIGVLVLDAHLDLSWTPRFSHSSQWARAMEDGILRPENLVMLGTRGVRNDAASFEVARRLGITYFPMSEIDRRGIGTVVEQAVQEAMSGTELLYLSFDIDVMDPSACPGQKYPDPGGLLTREAIAVIRAVADQRLCGMDLCCLSPVYDPDAVGAMVGARMLLEVLGGLAAARREEPGV
jgi:agmatinase